MKKLLRIVLPAVAAAMGLNTAAQCPPGETQVTVNITTDRYGDETTWTLTGPGGSPTYAQGGPYTLASANGAYPQPAVNACVPDGATMIFTVNDSYGDGMCCAYGNGGWTIVVGGATVASGGTFTNVETATVVLGTDLGIQALTVPAVVMQGSTSITGRVRNNGILPITGFDLSYAVDGGAPVSQSYSATVQPGASYAFTFTTPWNATVGSHTVDLSLTGVSGDLVASNNQLSATISVASQSVQRKVLIEEFTSSTCPPCASFNNTFDPLLTSLNTNGDGSNIAAVKYQMNWPSPGTDPSYNPDGNTRKNYYGVTGIPDVFVNGRAEPNSYANNATNLNNEAALPAFCTINLSATYGGNLLTVNASVTPHANFGPNHKLFIVAVESYSYTGGTTSQNQYKHAQRKILPDGNGINLSPLQDGVTQTFTQSRSFTVGGVAQGNYNLWGPLANVKVVAFVQNVQTKEVIQTAVVSQLAVGIDEQANALDRRLTLYPNPTDGQMNLSFDLPSAATVRFTVLDLAGKQVLTATRGFGSGEQRHSLDLSALPAGSYLVQVQANDLTATRKVTVSR